MNRVVVFLFWINVFLFLLINDRFVYFLPKSDVHNINETDINEVRAAISKRTHKDIEFHRKTDKSVIPVFQSLLDMHQIKYDLNKKYMFKHGFEILKNKLKYNRARPWQIDSTLSTLRSLSAYSPSYPSGHAYQAWILYRILSRRYPSIKTELYELAEYCTKIRVLAGVHYPSDGEFSKKLVMNLDLNQL